jgi:3D (Asp-Asp-Asp) domain-containing protein
MKKHRYAITIFLLLAFLYATFTTVQTQKRTTLLTDNTALKSKIEGMSLQINNAARKNAQLSTQIEKLNAQVRSLQDGKLDRPGKTNRGGDRFSRRTMHVTAYWAGSCGKKPSCPTYGITRSGEPVREWYTAAAYWPEIPEGTKIYIPYFKRVFVIEDTGGKIGPGDLDIFMESRKSCVEFGVKDLEVYILGEALKAKEDKHGS